MTACWRSLVLMVVVTVLVASSTAETAQSARTGGATTPLRFATSLGSHMVLAQAPLRPVVWGYTAAGTSVVVSFAGVNTTATVAPAASGGTSDPSTWRATLPALPASSESRSMVVYGSDGSQAVAEDVLVGDVIACSGQSNMAFLTENSFNGTEEVQAANDFPHIRFFTTKKLQSSTPLYEQPAPEQLWSVASNETISDDGKATQDDDWLYMSAVCYLYGKHIHLARGYPIGLVNVNWGGTPIEFWLPPDSVEHCSDSTDVATRVQPDSPFVESSGAFHAMITPLLNMTITQVIWWQGEANAGSNAADAKHPYICKQKALVSSWRRYWSDGTGGATDSEFPFGIVQLAAWGKESIGTTRDKCPASALAVPLLRQAQTGNATFLPNKDMPNTFMAVTYDLADPTSPFGDVHTRHKEDAALRLSLAGRAIGYGESVYYSGPMVREATAVTNKSVIVTFDSVGSEGLLFHTNATNNGTETWISPDVWEICVVSTGCPYDGMLGWMSVGAVSATSDASGSASVTLAWPHNAPSASAVRFAWQCVPCTYLDCPLYDKASGLPAAPFVLAVSS